MDEEMRKIDVNQAGVEELSQIPGIGENLAQRIIEYRETVHPFEEVIELTAVPGISERMVREFADQVTVEPVTAVERSVTMPGFTLEPKAEPAVPEAVDEEEIFEFITDETDEESEEETEEPVESVVEEAEETPVPEPVILSEQVVEPDEDDTAKLPSLYTPTRVEPEPEPQPRPIPQPTSGPSQGRVLGQILLGSILGAFVGALLTLAILAALNDGTLSFSRADTRLQSEIQDAQRAQNDLQQTVDDMNNEFNTNLGYVATRTGDLSLQQEQMTTTMRQTQVDVTNLEEVTQALDERLTTVAAAAETFNAFLDGLRGLLIDLEGGTATAVPETTTPEATTKATIEATPTATERVNGTSTATAVPSPTSRPTRTPRPTATPIPLPTSTPGQQP